MVKVMFGAFNRSKCKHVFEMRVQMVHVPHFMQSYLGSVDSHKKNDCMPLFGLVCIPIVCYGLTGCACQSCL